MINFAENAWISKGWLNVGRIHHQIGQNGLSVFSDISKVQALTAKCIITPVGINKKGFVTSNFGMFLLLDYCIENERGSVGTPLCRVLINILSKSSKIIYFSQNCHFHVM